MKRSIKVVPKKRGRPATGNDPVTAIRLSAELRQSVDGWASSNGVSSRSEAIRRLVEQALAAPKVASDRKALEREAVLKEQIETVFAPKVKPKAKTPAKAKAKAKGRK